jgi:hypothetical protein
MQTGFTVCPKHEDIMQLANTNHAELFTQIQLTPSFTEQVQAWQGHLKLMFEARDSVYMKSQKT